MYTSEAADDDDDDEPASDDTDVCVFVTEYILLIAVAAVQ